MPIQESVNRSIASLADEYGEVLVRTLKRELVDEGKYATGSLIDTMFYDVRLDNSLAVVELNANPYLRYVDQGRRPGKFPPIQAIRRWVNVRGLPARATFPIARAIAQRGIPATNVVNRSIDLTEAEFLPEYEQNLADLVGIVLVNDIFNQTTTQGRILPAGLR